MNKELAKKVLERLSLEELYNEIKDNNNAIYTIGLIIASKNKVLFCEVIRDLFEKTITLSKNEKLIEYFKSIIIEMDEQVVSIPVNEIIRKNTINNIVSTTQKSDLDPCSKPWTNNRNSC